MANRFNSRLVSRDTAIKEIRKRNETVYFTVGYRWKHPATLDKPLTPDEAVKVVERGFYTFELEDRYGRFCLNGYTDGDMW